jgi:transposase InsO family protein
MQVNRSGYYRYVKLKQTSKESDVFAMKLVVEMKVLHKKSRRSYGSRQMSQKLKSMGYKAGRFLVRRLMREHGIECKQRRRYKVTTNSAHNNPVADNKLDRNFTVSEPNKVWVADITYLWTLEGWVYVAAVLDLYSRRVVGWAIADHMRTELIADALKMAVCRRDPVAGLMHHSDRRSQYAGSDYQDLLKQWGIEVSMSRKGNCWDNAVMERFFGSLKSERTGGEIYLTRKQANDDVVDYIEMFYNSDRLHSTLGYVSPAEFENCTIGSFS